MSPKSRKALFGERKVEHFHIPMTKIDFLMEKLIKKLGGALSKGIPLKGAHLREFP
jgi:hypothetical protein